MSNSLSLILVGGIPLLLIIGMQLMVSTKKLGMLAYVLPTAFLVLAGLNLYSSLYVRNPHPTMQEGFLMTIGIAGFGVSTITLVIYRMIIRRNGRLR